MSSHWIYNYEGFQEHHQVLHSRSLTAFKVLLCVGGGLENRFTSLDAGFASECGGQTRCCFSSL